MDFRHAECRLSGGGSDLLLLLLNAEPARHPRRAGSIAKKDHPMSALRDLEEMIRQLLEAARKLPAGETRQSTLKEIGRLRVRLDAVSAQQSQSAK